MDKTDSDFTGERLHRFFRPFVVVSCVVHLLYLVLFIVLSIYTLVFTHGIALVAYAITLILPHKNHFSWVLAIFSLDVVGHALISAELLGISSNFLLYLIPCGVLVLLYSALRFMHRLIWFELLFLSYICLDYVFQSSIPHIVVSESILLSIRYFNLSLIFLSLGWMIHLYRNIGTPSSANTAPKADSELTDHLTGLFKRETVLKRIDEILTAINHNKQTMSIIILDIDNAAEIKKQFGNSTLDAVLIRLAEVLQAAIRYNDRASRWGGNEFMLLLPGGNKGSALRISERINQQLSAKPLSINDHEISLSLSFGIAEMATGEDFNTCLVRSEEALNIAKIGTNGKIYIADSKAQQQQINM